MKYQRKIKIVFLCLLGIGALSSCFQPANLFRSGTYLLKSNKLPDTVINETSFERDGKLIVEGIVMAGLPSDKPLAGEVQGKIIGLQGQVLEAKSALYKSTVHSNRNIPKSRYELIFDSVPPAGSTIELSYVPKPFESVPDQPIHLR